MASLQSQPEISAMENSTTLTTVSTVPATTDQFMFTPEFRRHFVEFVPGDTLMRLRLATKCWMVAADVFIDEGVKSGEIIIHGGEDLYACFDDDEEEEREAFWVALAEMRALVKRLIFLLNITTVGDYACCDATHLVVVDIPEGVLRIGEMAFDSCTSLTTVSFPTTLISIGGEAFSCCSSLENVDLLHTKLQEIGWCAFSDCSELTSVTIPDSLQKLDRYVFSRCWKLVSSSKQDLLADGNVHHDNTPSVIDYLRSQQKVAMLEQRIAELEQANLKLLFANHNAQLKIAQLQNK